VELLLDTHASLWWLDGDTHLSAPAQDAIGDETNTVWVSTPSAPDPCLQSTATRSTVC
jgi:PIN domain nuclease of toxin-antitoxin system